MVSYTKYIDLEIFEGKISKHRYPWHSHNCYTLITVEKGSILYKFEDKSLKVDEAEALLIEPFKVHRNIISQFTVNRAFFISQKYFEGVGKNKVVI